MFNLQIHFISYSNVEFDGSLLLAWPCCWLNSVVATDLRHHDLYVIIVSIHWPLRYERCGGNIKWEIIKYISSVNVLSIWCIITPRWMSQNPTDDESTLVQIMVRCCQAVSHFMIQVEPELWCHVATLCQSVLSEAVLTHHPLMEQYATYTCEQSLS